ncbi:MAG: TlpA family protein disulfide reductase [Planctomycetaceae bacterium]
MMYQKAAPHFFATVFVLLSATITQGAPPKDFTVESPTHGTKFTLSEAKGRVVVLHFLLKTECPYCLRYTHDYAASSNARQDVVHIFLKPDSAAEIKKWASHLDQKGLKKSPMIYRDADAALAEAFDIPGGYAFHGESVHYPALIALDSNGKELFRHVGKSNADRMSYAEFEKRLAASKR